MAGKVRVTSFDPGHAMALVAAIEKAQPGDVISVNNQALYDMASFKANQLGKNIRIIIEEE
jgi:hypothetical protein